MPVCEGRVHSKRALVRIVCHAASVEARHGAGQLVRGGLPEHHFRQGPRGHEFQARPRCALEHRQAFEGELHVSIVVEWKNNQQFVVSMMLLFCIIVAIVTNLVVNAFLFCCFVLIASI